MLSLGNKISTLKRGSAPITTLALTCTTTGAQTLTIKGLTVAVGKTVLVDWGDGTNNTYTAGAGTRLHNYAGAGAWSVVINNTPDITLLDLDDAKISAVISSSNPIPANLTSLRLWSIGLTYNANTNPLPSGLTSLSLYNLTGLTYNANTNPLPSGLTSLTLSNLAGLTYNVNTNPLPSGLTSLTLIVLAGLTYNVNTNPLPSGLVTLFLNILAGLTYNANTNPLPSGLTSLTLYNLTAVNLTWVITTGAQWPVGATAMIVTGCPGVTVSLWTNNNIVSIQAENSYSQANVNAFLYAILANKANFTYATPSLDLLGSGNAAPSGIYQAADPVTSGNEAKYSLVNGNGSYAAGPEWTVTTA